MMRSYLQTSKSILTTSRNQRWDLKLTLGPNLTWICQARQKKKIEKMVEKGVDPSKVLVMPDF